MPLLTPTLTRSNTFVLTVTGFFDGTTLREPTQEEIQGLIDQTILFYEDLLRQAFGDTFTFEFLCMFQLVSRHHCVKVVHSHSFPHFTVNFTTWMPNEARPFTMDFDAIIEFAAGTNPLPTQDELFAVMEATPEVYADYIRDYVWNSQPMGTVFFDVQNVGFDASSATGLPARRP